MSEGPMFYCTRQRAGPLVKECRAIRPRLSDFMLKCLRRLLNGESEIAPSTFWAGGVCRLQVLRRNRQTFAEL